MTLRRLTILLRNVAALAGVALAVLPAGAQSGAMTTAQVAAAAKAIVVAKVLRVNVRREVNIFTFVEFQTMEVVKGDVPPTFTYRMLGGRLGDVESRSGEPRPVFRAGEEVVLFLGHRVSQAGYPTIFQQSVFHVTTQPSGLRVVNPEPTGMTILRFGVGGNPAATTTRPVRLADFVHSLKQLR